MNVIREIERLNKRELELGLSDSASWHAQYKDSAYIFIKGLDYDLSEGDIICVFSQFGEVVDCNLGRDKDTGKSKGFCFLAFEDQRSTVLAVDNMNGAQVAGRILQVDHVRHYRRPKGEKRKEDNPKDVVVEEISEEEYNARRRKIWDYELYRQTQKQQQPPPEPKPQDARDQEEIRRAIKMAQAAGAEIADVVIDGVTPAASSSTSSSSSKPEPKLSKADMSAAQRQAKFIEEMKAKRHAEREARKAADAEAALNNPKGLPPWMQEKTSASAFAAARPPPGFPSAYAAPKPAVPAGPAVPAAAPIQTPMENPPAPWTLKKSSNGDSHHNSKNSDRRDRSPRESSRGSDRRRSRSRSPKPRSRDRERDQNRDRDRDRGSRRSRSRDRRQ